MVTLRVSGVNGAALQQKLSQLPTVRKSTIVTEEPAGVVARVFPKTVANGALARSIVESASGWKIEELHTEEGRLDDVFRTITLPETSKGSEVRP